MSVPVDQGCDVCAEAAQTMAESDEICFENELWQVRHMPAPYCMPGWLMLLSKRHVAGPFDFTDREAASFGPTVRHLGQVLMRVAGALRVYTGWMGESTPHYHGHFIPRYAEMPAGKKGWAAFDIPRAVGAGELTFDAAEAARVTAAIRAALAESPLPG